MALRLTASSAVAAMPIPVFERQRESIMFTISNKTSRPVLAVAAATVLALGSATSAHAGGPDDIGIRIVQDDNGAEAVLLSFNPDLLSTPDGAARLRGEIARATRNVCVDDFGRHGADDTTECRASTLADAERSLGVIKARRKTATQVASAP